MTKIRSGRVARAVRAMARFAPSSPMTPDQSTTVSAAAVSKALRRLPSGTFYRVARKLYQRTRSGGGRRAQTGRGSRGRNQRRQVVALDGSKIRLPPSFQKHGYPVHERVPKPTDHCVALLTALVDVHTKIPIDWALDTHFDERKAALPLLERLQPGTIVLCDRGYFSAHLVRFAHERGLRLVVRLRSNANKQLQLLMESPEMNHGSRTAATVLTKANNVPVNVCRYEIPDGTEPYYCLVVREDCPVGTAPKNIPMVAGVYPESVKNLYKLRWQVELFFRTLKSTLKLGEVRTTSPHVFRHELDIRCLTTMIVQLIRDPHHQGEDGEFAQMDTFLGVLRHSLYLRQVALLAESAARNPGLQLCPTCCGHGYRNHADGPPAGHHHAANAHNPAEGVNEQPPVVHGPGSGFAAANGLWMAMLQVQVMIL